MIIAAAFVVITSLILWFVIGSRGMWGLKIATIASALYFCLSIGFSLENFEGWPSNASLPEEFRMYWVIIEEPNERGDEGAIYIWAKNLKPLDDESGWWISFDGSNTGAPRSYKLPYTRDLHERSEDALKRIRAGKGVMGRQGQGRAGEGEGDGSEGPSGDGGSSGQGGGSLTKNGGITFQELPPTKLPDKGE